MIFNVKYFGITAEVSGRAVEELVGDCTTVQELKQTLFLMYPGLKELNFKIAVNYELAEDTVELGGDEEIALLPPFAGGWFNVIMGECGNVKMDELTKLSF